MMWTRFAFAALLSALAPPAAAQCLAIPDGTGHTVLHCSDGRVGVEHADRGGATSGMLGGLTLTAPLDPQPLGLVRPVNPSLATAPPPSIAPPSAARVPAGRPFSTYPDPAGAGMTSQPGESPTVREPETPVRATP